MRYTSTSFILGWALGLLIMPVAHAEDRTNNSSGYRIPTYDKIEFKAEASSDHRVSMSWSAFEGFNDEEFEYYKVIRSYGNPNPLYPEDEAIAVKMEVGDTRHTDEKAHRSAYYRVCTITNVQGRHCSNAIWVEIEKRAKTDCKNVSASGECEDVKIEKEKKEKEQKAWQDKQNQAKERLEERKKRLNEEKEAKQKEWEAKKKAEKEEHDEKKTMAKEDHEKKKAELYDKMYERLDMWLENFGERLDKSDMSNEDKVDRIEAVQKKFYEWEDGKEVRMKMVDYIDEGLNEMKEKYSAGDDFAEVDAFLNSLLEN